MHLIEILASVGEQLPATLLKIQDVPGIRSELVDSVCTGRTFPERTNAMRLLGHFGNCNPEVLEAFESALVDVKHVQTAALNAAKRTRSVDATSLDAVRRLAETATSASIRYACVQMLAAFAQVPDLAASTRREITSWLVQFSARPDARQEVFVLESTGHPFVLQRLGVLNDLAIDSVLQISRAGHASSIHSLGQLRSSE